MNDPFHPFGKADLLQVGLLTAYAAHMGSPDDQRQLLRMITSIPARLIGKKSMEWKKETKQTLFC